MGVKCVVHKLYDLFVVNLLSIEIDKDAPISGSVPVPISSISTNDFSFDVLVISDIFFICAEKVERSSSNDCLSPISDKNILKIGHYLRFDKSALEFFLKCKMSPIFCTKIASKLCRTYTNEHGLKNLVQEFCGKKIDKKYGSSDWNKDLNELSDKQLEYAANDVIYLHKIKSELEKMLIRENRMELFKSCLTFLNTRIELDQNGFKFDIFEH